MTKEFPLSALLREQLSYVQSGTPLLIIVKKFNDQPPLNFFGPTDQNFLFFSFQILEHKSKEPRKDSVRFHVKDPASHSSQSVQLDIVIEVVFSNLDALAFLPAVKNVLVFHFFLLTTAALRADGSRSLII